MGCMANGDFLLTSGILGAASVRVGLRRYLPGLPTRPRKVTDDEVSAFMASLARATGDEHAAGATPAAPTASASAPTDLVAAAPTATDGDGDGAEGSDLQVLAGR